MKIAIVSDAIYPYNKGGKEKRIYEISTRLVKLGHKVHIYCMQWWRSTVKLKTENGVHLHAISPYYPLYSGERRSIKQGIMFGLHCLKLIREDFDVVDVDHMPFFPLFAVKLVCILKRKKMFATWHEVWGRKYWRKYLGILGIIGYQIERLSTALPDKIISVSPHTTVRLVREMNYKKPISTIEMGTDIEFIKRVKKAEEKSDIIFVGRLLKHKNVDILIRSIKLLTTDNRLPKTVCLIIGDGPEKNNLMELTRELKIERNVSFKGVIEHEKDVYALMKSSKVFVLPSTREGFGIVVLEANACGIPVITTDYPGNAAKQLIKHGENGYLTALDKDSLAGKIKRVLESSALRHLKGGRLVRRSLGEGGMDSFQVEESVSSKDHDWKFVIRKIEEVYRV